MLIILQRLGLKFKGLHANHSQFKILPIDITTKNLQSCSFLQYVKCLYGGTVLGLGLKRVFGDLLMMVVRLCSLVGQYHEKVNFFIDQLFHILMLL